YGQTQVTVIAQPLFVLEIFGGDLWGDGVPEHGISAQGPGPGGEGPIPLIGLGVGGESVVVQTGDEHLSQGRWRVAGRVETDGKGPMGGHTVVMDGDRVLALFQV